MIAKHLVCALVMRAIRPLTMIGAVCPRAPSPVASSRPRRPSRRPRNLG